MDRIADVSSSRRWAGLAFIALTGLVHLIEAPEYYGEVKYVGVLFVASAIGALVAGYGIWKDEAWGWGLGIAVAGGAVVAYVLSRTVGLPDFREASWSEALEPMGVFSVLVELAFVAAAAPLFLRGAGGGRALSPS